MNIKNMALTIVNLILLVVLASQLKTCQTSACEKNIMMCDYDK